ncbi:hypothetical protein GTW51_08370 [Aurantimonas aggregata]|uniref:Uncharacterized protein n=1 Tax=Aurantimonas aggregata TaxID=2047720 RepID=A0A6L9MFZ8_9HYPH|nr:hypothetical protein [Aurantimonas aggregata]NDV86715.1 hypothetical protein [Aurantimonas aggregata]
MTLRRFSLPLAAVCLSFAAGPVFAQSQPLPDAPPEVPAPESTAPDMPPEDDPCAPGAAPSEGAAGQDDLTMQLQDCESVLTPPTTGDTGIEAPAPDADPGTTPVIPPSDLPAQQPSL